MSRENPNIFHFIKRKEKERAKRKRHPQSDRKARGHTVARSPHEARIKRKAHKTESARFQKAGKEENIPKCNGKMQKKQEKTRGRETTKRGKTRKTTRARNAKKKAKKASARRKIKKEEEIFLQKGNICNKKRHTFFQKRRKN